jgi:hypothetical protein
VHVNRTRRGDYLPWLSPAVTHHQPATCIVALVDELANICRDFSFQSSGEHPPCTLPDNLIDQRRRRQRRRILPGRAIPVDYLEHGRTFPTSASDAGLA